MAFHVGQKVVCVRDTPGEDVIRWVSGMAVGQKSSKIDCGNVYTIREIDTRAVHLHGVATLRFVGIVGRIRESTVGPWESGASFPASYFRPVVERKTDISIFERMLRERVVENV